MEAVSQLIVRNEARLPPGPVLLLNPPRDDLAQLLAVGGRQVRCWTQDFGDYRWLRACGADIEFSVTPRIEPDIACALLFLPREKERLAMLAHAIASQSVPGLRLWLVGNNQSGIKSAARHLQANFGTTRVLDKARHCRLIEAAQPCPDRPFTLDDYVRDWRAEFAGQTIQLHTLPGVFSHGRLDTGTRFLLETLADLHPAGRILDFGCGSGVLGLAMCRADPDAKVTLLDSSALAIDSARRALIANKVVAELLPSDGLSEVSGPFDWIVSNPPFHRGVRSDLDVAAAFFQRAGTFLAENGKIVVVFNRHLPYLHWMQESASRVERLAGSGEFTIAGISRPRRQQIN